MQAVEQRLVRPAALAQRWYTAAALSLQPHAPQLLKNCITNILAPLFCLNTLLEAHDGSQGHPVRLCPAAGGPQRHRSHVSVDGIASRASAHFSAGVGLPVGGRVEGPHEREPCLLLLDTAQTAFDCVIASIGHPSEELFGLATQKGNMPCREAAMAQCCNWALLL